jgi:hypothetical protein
MSEITKKLEDIIFLCAGFQKEPNNTGPRELLRAVDWADACSNDCYQAFKMFSNLGHRDFAERFKYYHVSFSKFSCRVTNADPEPDRIQLNATRCEWTAMGIRIQDLRKFSQNMLRLITPDTASA